jgi:Zn2+/Cd2+-exporting ATPase
MVKERTFRIEGLCCGSEVKALKQEVGPRVGGEQNLTFDLLHARMTVLVGPDRASDEQVIAGVRKAGMNAAPVDRAQQLEHPGFWQQHGRTTLTALSGAFLAIASVVHVLMAGSVLAALAAGAVAPASIVLYLLSILTGIWYVLPKAWSSLRAVRPDMNLLMTIAVIGAIVIGEWFEAATVAFLFAVALSLESWSVGRARRAVQSLLEAAPPMARVRRGNDEVEVHPEQVEIGELFIVRPGEKVPLDGEVISGTSEVNQAPITGESVPVAKHTGEAVYAGTINGDGLLQVRSTKAADQTTLANIIRLVTQAQSRRAPSEQWVEKFARVYTPVVLAMAAAVFLVLPLLMMGTWSEWFYRALVLLVIACPCALVISTPVSIVAALTRSAHQGVLVKGGLFMEAPARLNAIAFDKTGTLTEGQPQVTRLIPLNAYSEEELLIRAAALEAGSNHPLAQAVLAEASQRGITLPQAEAHRAIPGKGVTGRWNGTLYWLGSHRYLEERGLETPEVHEQLESLSAAGHSVVAVGTATHLCGLIALADRPRPQARDAIAALHRLGIKHIVMLTGDNHATAHAIARELSIDHVHAELLPDEKLKAVEQLVHEHGRVAMVGDGVNDAPALAASSLGIAMGAAGSDAAIETADIALMADDVTKLPWLVAHARRTLNVIRQNIALSLGIKALFVLLTLFGFATLWAAIAADMGASLLVIFNGLRLLHESRRQ